MMQSAFTPITAPTRAGPRKGANMALRALQPLLALVVWARRGEVMP